jgi:hypothetical protein
MAKRKMQRVFQV